MRLIMVVNVLNNDRCFSIFTHRLAGQPIDSNGSFFQVLECFIINVRQKSLFKCNVWRPAKPGE